MRMVTCILCGRSCFVCTSMKNVKIQPASAQNFDCFITNPHHNKYHLATNSTRPHQKVKKRSYWVVKNVMIEDMDCISVENRADERRTAHLHASPFPATRRSSPTERHRSDQKRPKETQITSVWYTQFKENEISHLVVDVAKCLHSANELCGHCSSALAGATWRWCQQIFFHTPVATCPNWGINR